MTILELDNYSALRAGYIQAFDDLASVNIDELTRNDMARVLGVAYGSIKSAEMGGKTNREMLEGKKRPSTVAIKSYLASLSPEALAELMK